MHSYSNHRAYFKVEKKKRNPNAKKIIDKFIKCKPDINVFNIRPLQHARIFFYEIIFPSQFLPNVQIRHYKITELFQYSSDPMEHLKLSSGEKDIIFE